ncbi:TetR/AcrR family transcriptional regulator [Kibdelosporangium philippinense]|uniref:TetR/AcrR family transcriptional regulator n=1 Tax=Kibdelosporangium philippinense TaxID=211113 RepID=A0ABS8ZEU4_9PSEU|nr:TetR/AcrR family transcriptional regulator [Kibdelosporangium philippinense]MCE7006338.1 TetR/AcrR family transcriptional regulator [Kibdelosporangium philippinense]
MADRPPTRRQMSAEQTRRKLLAVAMDEFSRRPYAEVTVGEIAKAAGVAHGLLSHHFNGKPGLYAETLRDVTRQLAEATQSDPTTPPGEQIRYRLRAYVDFVSQNEGIARNLILGGVEPGPEACEVLDSTRCADIRSIAGVLGLDHENPAVHLSMTVFIAAVKSAVGAWLDAGQPYVHERVVDALVELLRGALHSVKQLDPSIDVSEALTDLDETATVEPSSTESVAVVAVPAEPALVSPVLIDSGLVNAALADSA